MMFTETQSEMFIRTLENLLKDEREYRMARQRDLYKSEAERFIKAFAASKHSDGQSLHQTQWRGQMAEAGFGHHHSE